jgi:hypothetical protein
MRIRNIILAVCLAVLVPGMAAAKKPTQPAPTPEPGCDILVSDVIYKGNSYPVKIVRVPSYPGAWHNPTVTLEAKYTGSTQTQTVEIGLANVFSVTYVNATLVVPDDASFAGDATITAMIKEPLKRKNTYKTTTCSVTRNVQ